MVIQTWHRPLLFPPFLSEATVDETQAFVLAAPDIAAPPSLPTAFVDHSKLCSPPHFHTRLIVQAATHITRAAACACHWGLARPVYNPLCLSRLPREALLPSTLPKANPTTTVDLCLPVLCFYALILIKRPGSLQAPSIRESHHTLAQS